MTWHYTVGTNLVAILESGMLRPAIAGVPAGERPAVWFSMNPVWERTANKSWIVRATGIAYVLSREETETKGNGLFRFQVRPEAAPYSWDEFKRLSGASRQTIRQMERRARDLLALPQDWRVSFDPVPRDQWIALDVWRRERWVPFVEAIRNERPARRYARRAMASATSLATWATR
jgi:hypothetical protein